jgi:hypothetical protein
MRFPRRALLLVPVFVLAMVVSGGPSLALGGESSNFWAKLDGYHELLSPTQGAINTNGFATLKTHLDDTTSTITFRLEFSGLSSTLLVAHYHFAQEHTIGGVMVFLCGGGGQPACPAATSGVISGTITPANVVGPTAGGIQPGDMASVLAAIRNKASYVNMHTVNFPGGEIRGTIED